MSFRALSQVFRMNDYTIGKIVGSVVDAIWKRLSSRHMAVPSHDQFIEIASGFKERWNFPNVVGCIDGKHVRIKCPKDSGTMYYCCLLYTSGRLRLDLHWTQKSSDPIRHGCLARFLPASVPTLMADVSRQFAASTCQ